MKTPRMVKELVNLVKTTPLSYNHKDKERFHVLAKRVAQEIAKQMGLVRYNIRSNKAGIAVSGEVVLHEESIYIMLDQCMLNGGEAFMYRYCNGVQDYTGGQNRWMKWEELEKDFVNALRTFQACRMNKI